MRPWHEAGTGASGKRVGCSCQYKCNWLPASTIDAIVVQGEAALSNDRHILQFSNNLRTAGSPVPAPAATVNEGISKTSGRRKLAGEGPGVRVYSDQATGRRLAGEGPGARVYNDQGATQGVNVVRPAGRVACCTQAG